MGRLLSIAMLIVEQRMCEVIPSIDHQCVYSSKSVDGEFRWMMGGSDGARSGSNLAPGSRSSEMWPKTSWLMIRVVTAMFQVPQSLFPVSLGTSLVEGRVGGHLGVRRGDLGRRRNKIIRWLKRCRNNGMRKEIILGLKVWRNLERWRLKVIWYVLCIIVIVHMRGNLMKGRNRMRMVRFSNRRRCTNGGVSV